MFQTKVSVNNNVMKNVNDTQHYYLYHLYLLLVDLILDRRVVKEL